MFSATISEVCVLLCPFRASRFPLPSPLRNWPTQHGDARHDVIRPPRSASSGDPCELAFTSREWCNQVQHNLA
ncbi:uncharacterized protein LOC105201085 isoform X2 [Solenopsis invicta]|uniref:uncharacterized protein LOC105201085 isoform X2 n=1 Tax=Solenopsis invicta TaxID=13686 RepID=UPI000E33E4F5|nr:uncharacterized protein LOC105201085 isoform X2 [Solenopsis invicta]